MGRRLGKQETRGNASLQASHIIITEMKLMDHKELKIVRNPNIFTFTIKLQFIDFFFPYKVLKLSCLSFILKCLRLLYIHFH